MKTMKRSECAVLYLTLKRKWYDMIASGEKQEEYRDAKPYWKTRIENWMRQSPKKRTVVAFSNGRRKADMFFLAYPQPAEIWWPKEIRKRESGHPEWGEPETPHYVIQLFGQVELVDTPSEAARMPVGGPGEAGSHTHPSEACGGLHGAPTGIHGDNFGTNGERA